MAYLIGPQIKKLNTLIEKEMNNSINELLPNFTGAQFAVLVIIYENKADDLTQKDIETQLRLSHPTTRGMVKRLCNLDLIYITPMVSDRRQVIVKLTETGSKFMDENYDEITRRVTMIEQKFVKDIPTDEQEKFLKTLNKMIDNL